MQDTEDGIEEQSRVMMKQISFERAGSSGIKFSLSLSYLRLRLCLLRV